MQARFRFQVVELATVSLALPLVLWPSSSRSLPPFRKRGELLSVLL